MSDEVTVRLADDGPVRVRVNGQTFETGDTREVDTDHAEALPDYWEIVGDVDETCNVEKSDGEVCGRDLPCQYHSEG